MAKRKTVEDFISPAIYEKNYIREPLMELLQLAGGKPILFRAIVHRNNHGFLDRGYCTHIKVVFPGQQNKNIRRITEHVMLKGIKTDIDHYFARNPVSGNHPVKRATIYFLGYPELYTTEEDVRCGIRLAYNRMERPFCIGGANPDLYWFLKKARRLSYTPPVEKFLKKPS